ncbi:MAG TPA: hypothetical protein PKA58_32475, partial [Polyangium sp.]|nr:hypothetical protein [Polyangium sp.]
VHDKQIQPRRSLIGVVITALSAVACGPTVEIRQGSPTLPEDAAPPLAECAAPLLVPEGAVWLGPINLDEYGHLRENSCENGVGTVRLTVADVFLDPDEVTNGCYRHCVEEGACPTPSMADDPNGPAWDEPAVTHFAAILDEARAEAFCSFRGGRLASIAELARAMQGDELGVAQPEIFDAWKSCYAADFESSECMALRSHAFFPGDGSLRPMREIRSEPRDVGPYGHYDVFGSQAEVTATKFPPNGYPKYWCEDGAFAPMTYSMEPDASRAFHLPGVLLRDGYQAAVVSHGLSNLFTFTWYGPPSASVTGARCAYDVAP